MKTITTQNPDLILRFAAPDDAALVVEYMKKLGAYQQMAEKIIATEAGIKRLLQQNLGEAAFAIYKGNPVGFIYFCSKSSAFTGRSGLYIDGFLIDEEARQLGFGKLMMQFICQHALDRGCELLEWGCLDWNEPTIQFYRDMGAYSVDNMRIFRFSPEQMKENAARF